MRKDVLPTLSSQSVVYMFTCHCNSFYVGQTTQTLRKRIREHVPKCVLDFQKSLLEKKILGDKQKQYVENAKKRSSVCEHLVNNDECLKHYLDTAFKPIAKARNNFHLAVLEAILISTKKPNICKQKDHVYQTLLF